MNRYFSAIITLIILISTSISINGQSARLFEIAKNIEIFTNVYKELNRNFVDELDPSILMKTGIDAMTKSLDPYTVYYSEAEAESYRITMEGRYSGIGTVMKNIDSIITIVDMYKDSPAYKSGLRIGDKILEINGQSTTGKTQSDISNIVRGAPGTEISFKVQSYGENDFKNLRVIRSEINVPNVPFNGMVNENIAYIKLNTFTDNASNNIRNALKSLKDSFDVQAVILDLRDNGGGLLREAINVSNLFIDNGELLVFTRGKVEDQNKSYYTTKAAFDNTIPLVVLINERSASASEIVSGSVQDLDRGVLIGQKTFGKGLVQNFFPLGYNSRIKLTISKYYIPSGRCIQSKDYEAGQAIDIEKDRQNEFKTRNGRVVFDVGGVEPDIEIEKPQMNDFIKNLIKQDMIFKYAEKYFHSNSDLDHDELFYGVKYEDFMQFLKAKEFSYESSAEKKLAELRQSLDNKNIESIPEDEWAFLIKKIELMKKEDKMSSEDTITKLIQKEVIRRFYLRDEGIRYLIHEDPEIAKAVEILSNNDIYNTILNKSI